MKRSTLILSAILLAAMLLFAGGAGAKTKPTQLSGPWKLSLTLPSMGELEVVIDFTTSAADATGAYPYRAFTNRNGARHLMGKMKAKGAGVFTKHFDKGSLVQIKKGRLAGDSVSGILTSAFVNLYFSTTIENGTMNGYLLNGKHQPVGLVTGTKGMPALPVRNYTGIMDSMLMLVADKIYDPAVLQTSDWKTFESKMRKMSSVCTDDALFMMSFFYHGRKLPFSHFMLYRYDGEVNMDNDNERYVTLEEKSPTTLYMKVASFAGSAVEMDSVFEYIATKNYDNLIVDMRDNPGGSVEAGLAFSRHLTPLEMYGGVLLTQKYFRNHNALPGIDEYKNFTHFSEANYDLLMKGIHALEGICLKVVPLAPIYSGNMYILTNKHTASTCEPIVYAMKQNKRATIVGERTAGAMLNGETFRAAGGYKMVIPTATFYTADGYKIDGNGVAPDKEVPSDKALATVLEELNITQ